MSINRFGTPILVMAILIMGETVWAATYYVDRLRPGSDSNNGTSESTPFLTIPKCVAVAIKPGDTCLVKNGNYPEPVTMAYSGTAGYPITLKNYPGHTPKLQFSDKTNGVNRILLHSVAGTPNPVRYVIIEGLEITNAYNGVKMDAAENVIFRSNHIHDTWYAAFLGIGHNVTIEGNKIYHTGDFTACPPTCKHTHGLYLTGQGYTIINNIIYDTVLYGVQAAGYAFNAAQMLNTDFAGFSGTIANNTIAYAMSGSGIVLWDAGSGSGGNNPAAMQGIVVENNILYENCQIAACTVSGINFMAGAIGARVRNNVFYASGTGSTAFIQGGTSGSTFNADILTVNSLTTNPNMRNAPATLPASPDFRLQATSPAAIDRGSNLLGQVVVDFSGIRRPQGAGYDIGAYEFSSNVTSLAPPANLRVY
jgi:hypothetical protein